MDQKEKELFTKAVFDLVQSVPHGRVTTYGAIAKATGYPNLSRMVGRILSNCANSETPAHRVVNSQGILSGRNAFAYPLKMQELLEAEGISIINHKIQNWKHVFWNPLNEIHI